MKKILLILFAIIITTDAFAHSTKGITPNMDSKQECRKKKSALNYISKHKLRKGGELIKFDSYTGFGQRTVLTDGIKNNPIEITGYLSLPEGTGKVPIVIYTHSSGGPFMYIWNDWFHHSYKNLLAAGIGVMMIDNFCARGARETWRDQSRVPLINGAIDAMMALKLLKSHPRSNGKFGTTGHSRGGTNSFFLADVKFTSKFLEGTKGFDAILPEAAECRMSGFFDEPELTSNTKLLVVHGGADDYTVAKHCEEYAKKIKAKPGQVKIDIKEGWFHEWHSGDKPKRIKMAMTLHECPAIQVDNEGNTTGPMENLVINKYKLWPSMEAVNQAMQNEPRKAFKTMFKVFKGEKCLAKGVTIGGKHMDEYMPQFISFFKENLL